MDPGELNKRITILKKSLVVDENGFEVEGWMDFKPSWAKIHNINGREFFLAQQAQSKASKKITMRYVEELDTSINERATIDYKVRYKNQTYNLTYSDNIKEENRYLELLLESE